MSYPGYVFEEFPKWVKGVKGGEVVDVIVESADEEASQGEAVAALLKAKADAAASAAKESAKARRAQAKAVLAEIAADAGSADEEASQGEAPQATAGA